MTEPSQFLTPMQYAEKLNLSRMTVYRALRRGEIPHVRVGNSYRIPLSAAQTKVTT